MDDFIPSENGTRFSSPIRSGVEQLERFAIDGVATQNVARLRRQLENEPDEFARSTVLKLLLHEAEKVCLTRQQLDRIDRHMVELRELTYRQIELVEKGTSKGRVIERALKLLATLNDLMANYQTLRRRISSLAE
jgi:thiamine kinase-like enzyme